jgi:hypothetical protein
MGEVLPFRRRKKIIKAAPGIIDLENELTRLSIALILNDDHGAKEIKRKITDVENRIKEMRLSNNEFI